MRRIVMLLTVAMIVVAMLAASASVALAAPEPIGPKNPNSIQPYINEIVPGYNFGHCQSRNAKYSGPANTAQVDNPAILTKGEPLDGDLLGRGISCPKT